MPLAAACHVDRSVQRPQGDGLEGQCGLCKLTASFIRQPGLTRRNTVTMGNVHKHNVANQERKERVVIRHVPEMFTAPRLQGCGLGTRKIRGGALSCIAQRGGLERATPIRAHCGPSVKV